MKLFSINKTDRRYNITEREGFSCYGFDVLNRKAVAALEWLKEQGRDAELICGGQGIDVVGLSVPARVGTKKHFAACNAIIDAAGVYCNAMMKRCPAELTPQLTGMEGKRVEVVDAYGETRRFIVGKSSGWLPVHLEIAHPRSSGGMPVSGAPFKSIRVVG